MTGEELIYSGELTDDVYSELDEAVVGGLSSEWRDADVDVILEGDEVTVEGPETSSILNPFKTTIPTDSYKVESETTEYLRQAFD